MSLPTRTFAALALALLAWAPAVPPGADEAPASGLFWPSHLPYPVDQHHGPFHRVEGQFLKPAAAEALDAMIRAARYDGVWILVRSGYRSHAYQSRLFFGGAKRRGISLIERARVSAPPGFSEHHTGYAVDLDDARHPQRLRASFAQTPAGQWLFANAHRYCFELSFPAGNPQGIAYEPWHWRFVGSPHALETFSRARRRFPGEPSSQVVVEASSTPTGHFACSGIETVEPASGNRIEVAAEDASFSVNK